MTAIFVQPQRAEQAFERLYRSHVQDVYRYALMLMRNRDDAEDVAQTTFLKAYRAYKRGDRPRHPRKWLITIAHNTCGTRIRDAKRRPQQVELQEQLIEPTPVDGGDVDVQELVRAVGALAFNQRAALVMRELEGRTYAEIADVLELSTSAVETLLFRARRALREQLEGTLTCGEAERALSLQLDGRLERDARSGLRAHLRECAECASLARRQRARRAALRGLGPLPLPASLASWGGGAAIGGGVAVKAAALIAAGVAAVGTTHQAAEAITAPPKLERAELVVVRSASDPAVTPVTRAARVAPPVEARARRAGVTKVSAAQAPAMPAVAQAARAAAQEGAAVAAPAPETAAEPQQPELPAVPVVVPAVPGVPPVTVEVQLPSVPPLPVELPKVVVPVTP